ncbi:hypothetical protein M5689_009486 [Euphorbia peplus]|nr:hypothetical protein M5689_009486 [Euphorbia peplus]
MYPNSLQSAKRKRLQGRLRSWRYMRRSAPLVTSIPDADEHVVMQKRAAESPLSSVGIEKKKQVADAPSPNRSFILSLF